MQFKALSLALMASTATPALSCTLAIWLMHNTSYGGSNTVSCTARIYGSDSPDFENEKPDQAETIPCAGGCVDVKRDDETYHFCMDGTANMEIRGKATVSNKLEGDDVIFPDGKVWKSADSAFLGSTVAHAYYVVDAACPR